jgi:calcineurin-like phosphoesterase family protein
MKNFFFVSDTHFQHENALRFTDKVNGNKMRDFPDVATMDEYIIEKWNSVVKDGDHIYHLGDVTFGKVSRFIYEIAPRLKGKKRLIVGNHDNLNNQDFLKVFQKVLFWRAFKDWGFVCTHVPLRVDQFRDKAVLNVHGHLHRNQIGEPPYLNICVENWDYTPVHLDVILDHVKGLTV